jgi:hypothetical protein
MNRYKITKYMEAKSLTDALKKERDVKPDDAWKDETQPEKSDLTQIGFNLDNSEYYSPYLKRKKHK